MTKRNFLIDMDGVIVKGNNIIPGADEFIRKLIAKNHKFLVLTNNSIYTPGDLAHRLQTMGLDVSKEQIFTSAMAAADFLAHQKKDGKAFVIGESGLTEPIHNVGYVITDLNPDYVVLGETFNYNFEYVTKAVRLVMDGAHFLATNQDANGPSENGVVPACGAMAALISKASGKMPFFLGKPNPFMMRSAMNHLGVHSTDTVMIGDRMDTDIIAGIQSGLETILVLSGVTHADHVSAYPYQPNVILEDISKIEL